jgi:hypothetical protein
MDRTGTRKSLVRAIARLSAVFVLLGFSATANAQDGAVDCSSFPNATIDGLVEPAPSNLNVDTDCTVRNYPASNPFDNEHLVLYRTRADRHSPPAHIRQRCSHEEHVVRGRPQSHALVRQLVGDQCQ